MTHQLCTCWLCIRRFDHHCHTLNSPSSPSPAYPDAWSSGDEGVVHMVHSSGVGRAVSTGKAVIYHSVPDVIDTRTEVCGGEG